MKATRKYFIRVRTEYVGYYEVEANDLLEAEGKAELLLEQDMNDIIYPSVDCEEYDQDTFIKEENA